MTNARLDELEKRCKNMQEHLLDLSKRGCPEIAFKLEGTFPSWAATAIPEVRRLRDEILELTEEFE